MPATQLYDIPLPVTMPKAGLSAPIVKAPSMTSQQLAAANPARSGGILTTTSSLPIFVRLGADASASIGGFHFILTAAAPVEIPAGITDSINVIAAGIATGLIAFAEWLA